MDFVKVLSFGWPNLEFTCGDTYDTLVTYRREGDDLIPDETLKPTMEQIIAKGPQYTQSLVVKQLPTTLENLFLNALTEYKDLLPPQSRGQLFILKTAVTEALKFDVEAARGLIESATIPNELEPIRQALLDEFPEE